MQTDGTNITRGEIPPPHKHWRQGLTGLTASQLHQPRPGTRGEGRREASVNGRIELRRAGMIFGNQTSLRTKAEGESRHTPIMAEKRRVWERRAPIRVKLRPERGMPYSASAP